MQISKNNLTNILRITLQNNNAFYEMSNDFPEIAADLTTFKHNPNCSCKHKVTKFFSDKMDAGQKDILDKYILNKENLKSRIEKAITDYENQVLSGKIIIIDNSEAAWNSFVLENSSKAFRSFSIVEKENKLHIYFL